MAETVGMEGVAYAPSAVGTMTEGGNSIGFEEVSVAYRGTTVLSDFTLRVAPGEIVALLGPSGSGKTTALRAVAGFVRPSRGRVLIGETDVTALPPYARGIGMVVQNYALFPHMSVAENVAFGLRAQGADRALVAERVASSLDMVGMGAFRSRYPRQLSGGQQQRVAIARALAIRPKVLLLDEPLSALDAQIRRSMVEELARLHRDLPHLAVLYVTHDQSEALTLAERIAIMKDGRLAALGAARSLYRRPPSRFAAEFLGRANVLACRVCGTGPGSETVEITVAGERMSGLAREALAPNAPALLCIRPHDLKLVPDASRPNRLAGTVSYVDWQGEVETITVALGEAEVRIAAPPSSSPPSPGDRIELFFATEDATILADEQGLG